MYTVFRWIINRVNVIFSFSFFFSPFVFLELSNIVEKKIVEKLFLKEFFVSRYRVEGSVATIISFLQHNFQGYWND